MVQLEYAFVRQYRVPSIEGLMQLKSVFESKRDGTLYYLMMIYSS
jgi:hypothetical protein